MAKDRTGTKVKLASGTHLIGVLTAASFDDAVRPGARGRLTALLNVATNVVRATNVRDTAVRQAALSAAQDLVKADILGNACVVLNAGCFAAGTKLWTPAGYRNVEDIQPGDWVYARSEHAPYGPIAAKRVEEKFERTGRILHLHLPEGKLIRTTPEHPFFLDGKGWTAAGALQAGDRIRTDGGWAAIDDVFDTGTYAPVYNLRVAEYHTYFVGDEDWRFAVWAHNSYAAALDALAASPEMTSRGVARDRLNNTTHTKALLRRVGDVHRLYEHRLAEFATELRDRLALDGILTTRDQISLETATRVWTATVNANPLPTDLTLVNPYDPTTEAASYEAFQRQVLGNQRLRSYYQRMQALKQAGVAGVEKLVDQLPGGRRYRQHPERLFGMHYHLLRAEAYLRAGRLAEVEYPAGTGEVDLRLTDGTLVDAKDWKRDTWLALPQGIRDWRTDELEIQIHRYLDGNDFRLRLEFRWFIPDEVTTLINDLRRDEPALGNRVSAVVERG